MLIRLKLMAPVHRPRAPRPRGLLSPSAAALPADFLRLAMAALRLHQLLLARHGRPAQFLAQRRTLLLSRRVLEVVPFTALERFVDGLDDGNVDQAFLARR